MYSFEWMMHVSRQRRYGGMYAWRKGTRERERETRIIYTTTKMRPCRAASTMMRYESGDMTYGNEKERSSMRAGASARARARPSFRQQAFQARNSFPLRAAAAAAAAAVGPPGYRTN